MLREVNLAHAAGPPDPHKGVASEHLPAPQHGGKVTLNQPTHVGKATQLEADRRLGLRLDSGQLRSSPPPSNPHRCRPPEPNPTSPDGLR